MKRPQQLALGNIQNGENMAYLHRNRGGKQS